MFKQKMIQAGWIIDIIIDIIIIKTMQTPLNWIEEGRKKLMELGVRLALT